MVGNSRDIATRSLVVALKTPCFGKTTAEVVAITGLPKSTVNRIYARAISRGFNPNQRPLTIRDCYVEDAHCGGHSTKCTEEMIKKVIAKVCRDRYGREKSCACIAKELKSEGLQLSKSSVWGILRAYRYHKTKPTRKPGLTKKMRQQRLDWCMAHKDWTLDDWKNVIWSDETSVILLHRRGGYRVWRRSYERFLRSCIRERWKGSCEFMFWGCFSYEKKGPSYCWGPETAFEKKKAKEKIDALNKELEPLYRQQWELSTGIKRLKLQQLPGKKPTWKWKRNTGKLTRGKGKGIDWWRYQNKILIPLMIPFAKECMKSRPETVVQEDKAPAHVHYAQQRMYDLHKVRRLLWCGNSPDLNAIEPCWGYLKRKTTKKGAPKNRAEAIKVWGAAWKELPQEKIQDWIERIPVHVQKVIELEGGNEYKEGKE